MTSVVLAVWLALSLWGVTSVWRRGRAPRVLWTRAAMSPQRKPSRTHWLRNWGGWLLISSVASFAPALAPDAPLWTQSCLFLSLSTGLLWLAHALDTPQVGHGVVAGLGLIALFLDSLSGGGWAQHGALGHHTEIRGIGELYGALAMVWGLIVCRAWLSIEGNPLGAAYLMGLLALWLGWQGQTPALGWGASLAALTLSLLAIQREHTERRRVRIAMQNQPTRIVRVAPGYDLALHGAILLGLCVGALWLSGAPAIRVGELSVYEGGFMAVGVICGMGIWRARALRPLPPALQRAWQVGTLATALLSAQPMTVVALSLTVYWGLVGATFPSDSKMLL
ncbi:MAG: hypothetical protein N2554_04005 [Fimbriimonadales bacterium]|nr:hypothetical protein [Fimbriimonadales bacterium]